MLENLTMQNSSNKMCYYDCRCCGFYFLFFVVVVLVLLRVAVVGVVAQRSTV